MKPLTLRTARPVFPAITVGIVLAALWAYARYVHHPSLQPAIAPATFINWLLLMFLLSTAAVVFWTATVDTRPRAHPASRTFLAYALVSDLCGLLVLLIGVAGGLMQLLDAVKIYALLIAWLGLCTALAALFRRFSPVVSLFITLALAALFVTAPLLTHAANPVLSQPTDIAAHASPILALLDAIHPSVPIPLADVPELSHLTTLPPATPLPLWWITAIAYALLAILLYLARRPWRTAE